LLFDDACENGVSENVPGIGVKQRARGGNEQPMGASPGELHVTAIYPYIVVKGV
jgi:hypothetical protein